MSNTSLQILAFLAFFSLFNPSFGQFNGDLCIFGADAQSSYQQRVKMTIDAGIKEGLNCFQQWNPGHCTIWVAGACLSSNNSIVIKVGYQVAAGAFNPKFTKVVHGRQ